MQIDITGHHVEVSDSLKDYVRDKCQKLERHFDNVVDAHFILTVEKLVHKAEATIMVRGGKIYADATNEDMYAAIDALVDKLDRQVVKHKEKIKDHRRAEGAVSQAVQE